MSQIEINICREIIAEHFGPVVEKIITKLIPKGRQTLSQLIKETQEDSKTTRDCLVILIQHNLVTFATTIERGRSFIFYEANIQSILLRLRFPQYIYLTRTELGQSAAKIIETLLEYGRLQASDIKDLTKMSEEKINSLLEKLSKKSLVIPVTKHDQSTKSDVYLKDEAEEVAKSQVPLTATELKKLKARMNAERNAEIAQGPTGAKRKILTFEEAEKRMRLEEGGFDFLSSSDSYKLNVEQYHIYFRNQDIEEFATSHLNQSAGDVTRVFINQVRDKMMITKEIRSGIYFLNRTFVIDQPRNSSFHRKPLSKSY
jgi:DNA-directed RNA polymerase III subunit RPC3